MPKKVLIADKLEDICAQLLQQHGVLVNTQLHLQPNQLKGLLCQGYNGIIVRSSTRLTGDIINAAKELEIIGRAGAGVDNIDIEASTKNGIIVCNTPYVNSISVAELVFGFMLSNARSIVGYDNAVKQSKWPRGELRGKDELYEKTIGIIGMGNIGKEVAKRAESFGMKIVYSDPFVSHPNYTRLKLHELFGVADIITIHVPALKETEKMITLANLLEMKQNAILINTARAQVIDSGALEEALAKRSDICVALDVHEVEKSGEKPLARFGDRVLLTPHIGATTNAAQNRAAEQIAKQLIDYFQAGKIRYAVNFTSIPDDAYPVLELVEKMACLGTILLEEKPVKIEYTCYGQLGKHTTPLENAMVCGVLRSITDVPVTYINASLLAQQNNLAVVKREPDASKQYSDAVTVDVIASQRISVRGKLTEDGPLIVRINDFFHNLVPVGQKNVFLYEDKPGVVSVFGNVCEKYGINIDNLTISHSNGHALAVFDTNPALSELQVNEIKQSINDKRINVAKAKVIGF